MQPGFILVGSSGGLFGLMGICVADIVLNWKVLFLVFCNEDGSPVSWSVKCCAVIWLVLDLMANAIIGFTPFVDNFAHMGGLAYGFFISLTVLQCLPLSFFGRGNGVLFKLRQRPSMCVRVSTYVKYVMRGGLWHHVSSKMMASISGWWSTGLAFHQQSLARHRFFLGPFADFFHF
jgi:hypothetical protein